ncbi:MAG: hypothetical protein ACJAS9_000683 [Polaribacter sp.]|jgi:hypothetical protein
MIKDAILFPFKGASLIALIFFCITIPLLVTTMTLTYMLTGGQPLWMISIPVLYILLLGLINFCHAIIRSSIQLENFDIQFKLGWMAPNQNTSATRTILFIAFGVLCFNFLPSIFSNLIIAFIIICSPAWLLILALEHRWIQALRVDLWVNTIKTLGYYYWVLFAGLVLFLAGIYYFLMVEGSFLNLVFSIYLIMVYHRFIGVVLRKQESFVNVPDSWEMTYEAKSQTVKRPELAKCRRIIQSMNKNEPVVIVADKYRLMMTRQKYEDGEPFFIALTFLDNSEHAIKYCEHYLPFLSTTRDINPSHLKDVIDYCLSQKENYLLKKDYQNVMLATLLWNNSLLEQGDLICDAFLQKSIDSEFTSAMVEAKSMVVRD